ncbi:hypothetical protein [Pedobacter sp. Leaf250]|uniref:hypothetical protein n=1 Tax=Pedobacter sp. Leaf250 TaxID=2876559 RepID=UPI001E634B7D|nr:hypothetical protein [Pedobacter sp. Leaf250]
MRILLILLIFCIHYGKTSYAQSVVFDKDHFAIVNENGFARISSEMMMQSTIDQMNRNLENIKLNTSALVLTQQIILRSLTQVDQGLKTALAVKEIAALSAEIFSSSQEMIGFASRHPHLLLFAEQVSRQLKDRGIKLVNDVSQLALKEGENLLLNFEKRDGLIKKISLELKLIRALVFSLHKTMFWAAQRSFIKQINPFKDFINTDQRLAGQIILNYKMLKK